MSVRDGGQETARCRTGDRRSGGPRSCSQGTGPVHRRTAPARGVAAARAAPDQRGTELREPVDGEDRRDDRRGPLRQSQHHVPPPATAGRKGPDSGGVGASGAAVAALLRDHGAGKDGVRAARGRGPAVPRLREVVDRRDRARGVRQVRTARAGSVVRLTPAQALALWSDVERWPSFVEGFARRLELASDWPAKGARVVWESTPDGRGRVTETVLENDPEHFSTTVYEEALIGTQTLRVAPTNDGTEVQLELEYQLEKYGPLAGLADAIFIRRALRDALRRTLFRFGIEAEDEAGLR